MAATILEISPGDDLIIALRDLYKGQKVTLNGQSILLHENIPAKHQFAVRDFKKGEQVRMYGIVVGQITRDVKKGALLHPGNLIHSSQEYSYRSKRIKWQPPDIESLKNITFPGYLRKNCSVGTANYWLVVPLVFCENENIKSLQDAFKQVLGYDKSDPYRHLVNSLVELYQSGSTSEELLRAEINPGIYADKRSRVFKHVDGIKFLTHESGCGGTRRDAQSFCGLLAGYIVHPNVAGATILGLGCQNATVSILRQEINKRQPDFSKPLFIFEQQQCSSEKEMLNEAIRKTFAGLVDADKARRSSVPVHKLTIGMECGASDGFSGISANPVVGKMADILVACGGNVILSEFPEFCGVEQSLIDRCVDKQTADKFIHLYEEYASRARADGSGFYMNPSPGNIREGLITDAIKSAGAAIKGGFSPVVDVLDYPLWVQKQGLNLLCTPGNDVESTTGLAAAGANLILFSTGLGTPAGNPIVPVIKIASNTTTATKFPDIIDFDAGPVIDGSKSITDLADDLFALVLKTAGGEYLTKAVLSGHDEFIPWKRDVSL
ncbi:altronate dehydratase [candidate division KSB1 bacterium]|nr:altronate dehydratase [candidate division KSB1 bacterium]